MNVLLDTNILGQMAETGHVQHPIAVDAVAALVGRGDIPCLVPQVLYEFWTVATRPPTSNGLGYTARCGVNAAVAELHGSFLSATRCISRVTSSTDSIRIGANSKLCSSGVLTNLTRITFGGSASTIISPIPPYGETE